MWPPFLSSILRATHPLLSSPRWRRNNISVNKVILVGRLGRDPKTRYQGWGQRHSEPCAFVQFPVSYRWSSILACDEVDGAPFGPRLLQVCH